MSNRILVICIVVILLVFAGVVVYFQMKNNNTQSGLLQYPGDQQPIQTDGNSSQDVSPSPTQVADTGSCKNNFDANILKTAKVNIQNRQVEIDVKDFGKMTVGFYDKDAPKAVENFLRLTNAGYYNCLTFHRVAKGFVIQGGDPTGTGSGGDSAFGGEFADELNSGSASYKAGYKKGVLAMANRGPNTNTSQFFIMLDDVELNHAYTIFGKVTAGLDVVDKIGAVQITPQMGPNDGKPVTPVVMESVKIIK